MGPTAPENCLRPLTERLAAWPAPDLYHGTKPVKMCFLMKTTKFHWTYNVIVQINFPQSGCYTQQYCWEIEPGPKRQQYCCKILQDLAGVKKPRSHAASFFLRYTWQYSCPELHKNLASYLTRSKRTCSRKLDRVSPALLYCTAALVFGSQCDV